MSSANQSARAPSGASNKSSTVAPSSAGTSTTNPNPSSLPAPSSALGASSGTKNTSSSSRDSRRRDEREYDRDRDRGDYDREPDRHRDEYERAESRRSSHRSSSHRTSSTKDGDGKSSKTQSTAAPTSAAASAVTAPAAANYSLAPTTGAGDYKDERRSTRHEHGVRHSERRSGTGGVADDFGDIKSSPLKSAPPTDDRYHSSRDRGSHRHRSSRHRSHGTDGETADDRSIELGRSGSVADDYGAGDYGGAMDYGVDGGFDAPEAASYHDPYDDDDNDDLETHHMDGGARNRRLWALASRDRPLNPQRLNALLDLLAKNPEITEDISKKGVLRLFWCLAERLREGFEALAKEKSDLEKKYATSLLDGASGGGGGGGGGNRNDLRTEDSDFASGGGGGGSAGGASTDLGAAQQSNKAYRTTSNGPNVASPSQSVLAAKVGLTPIGSSGSTAVHNG